MVVRTSACVVDITPQHKISLFGRRGRFGPFSTIKTKLEANIILIGTNEGHFVTIGLDTLYPSTALKSAILESVAAQKIDLVAEQVMIVASHTHNAPCLDPTKPQLGTFDQSYFDLAVTRISKAIVDMFRAPKETPRYHYAEVKCDAAIYRRRPVWGFDPKNISLAKRTAMAPDARVTIPDQIQYFSTLDAKGAPVAIIWQWPCHAVFELSPDAISADFPGLAREYLRELYAAPNLPVIFMPGFSGDIRPDTGSLPFLHRKKSWIGFGPKFSRRSRRARNRFVALLLKGIKDIPSCVTEFDFSTEFKSGVVHVSNDDIYETWTKEITPLRIGKMHLGGISIVGVSAEMSSAYLHHVREKTFFTGCVDYSNGYIPTDVQIAEGGYEGGDFLQDFSMQARFKALIQDDVTSHFTD